MRVLDFGSRSIKQKQILILMLTSSLALLLASTGFVVFEVVSVRHDIIQKLESLAYHIGCETTPYVNGLGEVSEARGAIGAAIRNDQSIVAAAIYMTDGTPRPLAVFPMSQEKNVPPVSATECKIPAVLARTRCFV
jgi:hypothetical protein